MPSAIAVLAWPSRKFAIQAHELTGDESGCHLIHVAEQAAQHARNDRCVAAPRK